MASQRRYALVTKSGTACSETVLTEEEYAKPEMRARVEQDAARTWPEDHQDRPVPGSWVDVTDNEACDPDFNQGDD